ncbi:PIR protein [Plasmodium ovale]|uniref:PIR protein n=1 Tax=Plasmodium ovale TaxID=36330 RepID=A0A1C3KNI6_PLAOA|nr:PIR protein [Plasmodium ovale]
MAYREKDFTLVELGKKHSFIKDLDLYKFCVEMDKQFDQVKENETCNKTLFSGVDDPDVIAFLIKVSIILNRLLNNEISVNNISKLEDKRCIYLKYWLYEKLITLGFDPYEVNMTFYFLKKHNKGCITSTSTEKPCNFYKLSLKDIYVLKNIYNYSETLFNVDTDIYDKISKDGKYLDYVKNGLNLYKSSKIRCPTDLQNEYCNEFNEYEKIHNKSRTNLNFLPCREKLLSSLNKKDTITGELPLTDKTSKDTMDPELNKLLMTANADDKIKLKKFYELLSDYNGSNNESNCDQQNKYLLKKKKEICGLLGSVENILEKWEGIYTTYDGLDNIKSCNYFNYWLYEKLRIIDATPCDIEAFYQLWHDLVTRKPPKGKTCNQKDYFGYNKEELGIKKKIFDFIEYYNEIKSKLREVTNDKNKEYCQYVKSIFQLYKIMKREINFKTYREELIIFQKTFSSDSEIDFLKEKCPDECLGFVFNEKLKTLCPFEDGPVPETEKGNLRECKELSHSISSRGPDGNSGKDYKISDLTSSTVYNELNGEVSTDKYYSVCSKLIPYNKQHCGIYDLCSKLVRNLIKLSHMKKQDRTHRCKYITHWIYDEIGKILNIGTNNIYDTDALRAFFSVSYDVLYKLDISDCLHKTLNVNFKEQKEQKNLHDYFKNYDKISGTNGNNCTTYFEYINDMNKLYEMYIDKCCYCFTSGYCIEDCPDYFKCDKKYNPYTLYEKLGCNKSANFIGKLKKVHRPQPADHYVKLLAEISETKPDLLNWGIKKKTLGIPEKVHEETTWNPFYTFSLGGFGFLGLFLVFFIFYKFTPLGSYFHKGNLEREKKKSNSFETHQQELLEYDSEFMHENLHNRRIRLAYNQA